MASSNPAPLTELITDEPGSYRYHSNNNNNNNAFPPGRYFRTNNSYQHRRFPEKCGTSPRGLFGSTLHNSMDRPKPISIIRNGQKPRHSIKIFLNRRTVQTFEQLIKDISEAFGARTKNNFVGKLFTIRGKEVQGISDFFRGDEYFVAFGTDESSVLESDVVNILQEVYLDSNIAKTLLLDWKKNERRRRKINPSNQFMKSNKVGLVQSQPGQLFQSHGQDKRDSGFDSAEVSTSRSEPEQIDRLSILRPKNKPGIERGNEREEVEEGKHEVDSHPTPRQVRHSYDFLKKRKENMRLMADKEGHRKLKKVRHGTRETERGIVSDEKKKVVLLPLKNNDNLIKNDENAIVKEAQEVGGGRLAVEEKKTNADEQQHEILQESLVGETVTDVGEIVNDTVNVQAKEIGETVNAETEKTENDVKRLKSGDISQRILQDAVEKPEQTTEPDTKVASVAIPPENKRKSNLVSIETVQADKVAIPEVATGIISTQTEAKDKNNNQQPKEKRKQDREEQQQRKRAKTKIVRKTKLERQVSSDEFVLTLFEMGRKLGDGNFAIVRHSRKKETGQEFAMKIIDKAKLKGRGHMVENEIDILKDCSHQNIVRLYEEYETQARIYLVMELVKGGDLFDVITQNVRFRETDSAVMVRDLCNALFYLHSRSIVHRDLKPENLLVHRNKEGTISVKLADFGLAMEVKDLIFTVCGTPTYVAPEILMDIGYGLEVDMWAVGVITYILLCGFPPFRSPDRNQSELFEFIKAGDYEFLSPYWDNISRSAKDLIRHLLIVDRKNRYTAVDVLCHKWILHCGQTELLSQSAASLDTAARQTRSELDNQAKHNYKSYQRLKEKKKQEKEEQEE